MTDRTLILQAVSASNYQHINVNKGRQYGFTLIELMVAVSVFGIIASLTIPSYRQYMISNAEKDTQAKLLNLQIELERWRATALTYKGFIPQNIDDNGDVTYSYEDSANTIINIPQNSGDDYTYRITLVDGDTSNESKSLVSDAKVDNVTGRTWKMVAVPNPKKYIKQGRQMMLTSNGIQCMTTDSLTFKSEDCGTKSKAW